MQIRLSEGFEAKLEDSLLRIEDSIEKKTADDKGPIQPHEHWAEGAPEGILHEFARDRVVHLTKKDFEHGTLRVLVPCKLVLCESIEFNPNSGVLPDQHVVDPNRDAEHDWFPRPGQAAYDPGQTVPGIHGAAASRAFRLGFFAAITIEHGEGTIIDLNGFQLSCHNDFAMQQRFHALIELANQPFLPGQGPADFGDQLRSARKVWIRDGVIGRSAHHGIHGNGMQDVLVTDVTFRDYEVAGISLNGGRRIVVRDCQLEGTFDQVPILGTYSAGRFAKLVGSQLIGRSSQLAEGASPEDKAKINQQADDLQQKIADLNCGLDAAFNFVKIGKLDEVDALFRNPAYEDPQSKKQLHLADANPYGIAIHARGVLVNAFLCNGSKIGALDDLARAFECTDVTLERVNIAKTRGRVREVLALAVENDETGGFDVITDATGAVFRFFPFHSQLPNTTDDQDAERDDDGRASLTLLGKVQIGIALLERALVRACVLPAEGVLTKSLQPLLDWAQDSSLRIVQSSQKHLWKLKSSDGKVVRDLQLRSNGDLMHHVNKGGLGLFVQAVDGLRVNRVVVAAMENVGLPGSNKAGGYQGPDDGGHGSQGQQIGYSGADARGLYFGACSNVCTDRIQAHGVVSRYGQAVGIEFAGGTEHAEIHSAVVGNVVAGAAFQEEKPPKEFSDRHPNAAPQGVGLVVDSTTRNIGIEDFQVTGQISQPGRKEAPKIRVEARLNNLSPGH